MEIRIPGDQAPTTKQTLIEVLLELEYDIRHKIAGKMGEAFLARVRRARGLVEEIQEGTPQLWQIDQFEQWANQTAQNALNQNYQVFSQQRAAQGLIGISGEERERWEREVTLLQVVAMRAMLVEFGKFAGLFNRSIEEVTEGRGVQ